MNDENDGKIKSATTLEIIEALRERAFEHHPTVDTLLAAAADRLEKTMPSAPAWTPCSEGLPTKTADYKVTVQVGSEMGTWRETKIIPYRTVDGVGEWILPKSDWLIYGVIAWTQADEPYQGEK